MSDLHPELFEPPPPPRPLTPAGRLAWGCALTSVACALSVVLLGDPHHRWVLWPLHANAAPILGLAGFLGFVAMIAGSIGGPDARTRRAGFVGLFTLLCGGCLGVDRLLQLGQDGSSGPNLDGSVWRQVGVTEGDSALSTVTFRCDRSGWFCRACDRNTFFDAAQPRASTCPPR